MVSSWAFGAIWLLPLVLLVVAYVFQRSLWSSDESYPVKSDNARAPFVAGVSVLAIAIPLIANSTFEVSKATPMSWIVAVLLGALTFALVALVIGTILIYHFSIPSHQFSTPPGNNEDSSDDDNDDSSATEGGAGGRATSRMAEGPGSCGGAEDRSQPGLRAGRQRGDPVSPDWS